MEEFGKQNLDYQAANSPSGGSYTEKKLARLALPPLAGKRFLDLGCNAGFHCRYALDQGASFVMGVDVSPSVIAKAREASPPQIVFRDTGWDDFPPGTFDVVILLSAIHYARSPRNVARNVRRALSSDGVLVLEGGVLFAKSRVMTDIPLPGWRKVGDRCLHLTEGFLQRHLLLDFDWTYAGDSEMRGGDDVARHVIHARPSGAEREDTVYALDMVEYFQACKQSAATIVPAQPAHAYVAPLQGVEKITADHVSRVMSDPATFDLVMKDLQFCLAAIQITRLRLCATIDGDILKRMATVLGARVPVETF